MPEAVIVATARSPIGRAAKGSLVDLRRDDLSATIIRAALAKVPQLDPHEIDDLYLGCGLPGGEQGFNLARVVAVLLGYDFLPGATLTRYCSSSLQTTRMAMHAIRAGEGDVFISAGVECVSRFARGNSDRLPPEAQALVGGDWQNPVFDGARTRSETRAQGGAPTWHDPGAAAVIVMSETKARDLGITPLARIVSTGVTALSPEIMGLGPVEASRQALRRAGMTIDDLDLVEINEAFAAQVIPSYRELGVPLEKLNVMGGAIAVGHPFGMTGARITGTLLNALDWHDRTVGLETMCVGGGQGMAMIVERIS